MWSTKECVFYSSLFLCALSQQNSPSFNGRSQLRPNSRDYLISIEYQQWEYEAKRSKQSENCRPQLLCAVEKYRTTDGTCNNLQNPRWGKSMECVQRIAEPVYSDGSRAPRIAKSGRPLPNARRVSTVMHSDVYAFANATHMLMQWGQFLDHDLSFTPSAQFKEGVVDCCSVSNIECFPIQIPDDDPFYSQFNRRCMSLVRSAPCLTCTMFREQINSLTAFIDASNVYGSTDNETRALRRLDGTGKLRAQQHYIRKELLPGSLDPENDQCSNTITNNICFAAGDSRVNLIPSLTALHTIFLREHNRLCALLSQLNPQWNEDTLFEEARRIVGVEMQVITFKEFLPIVLGPENMIKFNLTLGGRTVYNPNINPTIYNEFSTAAFRFGHTLIDGLFHVISHEGNRLPYGLKDHFFDPFPLYDVNIDPIIRGMIGSPSQRFDPFFTDHVRNHLYQKNTDKFGNDLVAFNIQRGRDHAIPGYTFYVNHCHGVRITSFQQLGRYMPQQQWQRYEILYESVDDIDLFSGMISEFSSQNAIVGPTIACIIGKQFHNLKYGDRFWFEHSGQSGSFTDAQVAEIRKVTFAVLICLNGDFFCEIQSRVFEKDTGNQGNNAIRSCRDILHEANISISPWQA